MEDRLRAGVNPVVGISRAVSVADDKSAADGDGRAGRRLAFGFWMATYLRTERHLSATGTGLYAAVQQFGALISCLLGAYLADAIGRKSTFMISAIATIIIANPSDLPPWQIEA
jgi:MFS family permease